MTTQPSSALPPRLLLIDDDPALLEALVHLLALRLPEVVVDHEQVVEQALSRLQTEKYDLLICDIVLPGANGLDLLSNFREVQQNLPVIFITGHGEQNLAIRALRLGAYDYLLKPIDRDLLVASVKRAIHTHRLQSQVEQQQQQLALYTQSLEEQVEQRTQQLRFSQQTREDMLRMVTHELAGSLMTLEGWLYMSECALQDGALDQMPANFIRQRQALRRFALLIHDLQDASLIQTGTFQLQRRVCNIVELCQEVVEEFAAGSTLLETPDESQRIEFLANIDEQRVSQALLNLLANARKYAPSGSPIAIILTRHEEKIALAVRDYGIGIAAEHLSRIYEQFYRVPDTQVQDHPQPGLGLGLFITQTIVEQHGGRIEVQSTLGSGSTFTLLLPCLEVAEQPAAFSTPLTWNFLA
ncbi:MAG TPA: hybrid sensor histidine kinase/response regulator [Ktedonobacteraceae bacterium]|nr:hybrid sensor histidine kinase/response regulator [Ktedonobacteraceae bacterium]